MSAMLQSFFATHLSGARTILPWFGFNQAAHQENVLLAIILCLHWLMSRKSS